MISVLHVIDETCDETVLQVLELLRARSGPDRCRHSICSIDGRAVARARQFIHAPVERAERRFRLPLGWSPRLAGMAGDDRATVVHAWGVEAARTCIAGLSGLPLVMTLIDPEPARRVARWLGSFPAQAAIAVGSQIVRTRLLAGGVPAEQVVVIRGAVDFGAITRSRDASVRDSLVGSASTAVLLAGPPSRAGGQYDGLWAAAILRHAGLDLRLIMPYASREAARLRRFARAIRMSSMLAVPGPGHTWPQLAAASDVLLIPAVDEVCTEAVGWAMAAGVPIVGCAVRSVAELIADRSNGLLCKPREPRVLARNLLSAIEDVELRTRITETARGQAYEVFGVRRFVDEYLRLYDNLLSGKACGEAIRDAAMVA